MFGQDVLTSRQHWLPNEADYTAKPVVRGGVEPPTFRFSGLGNHVQRRLQLYTRLLTLGFGC